MPRSRDVLLVLCSLCCLAGVGVAVFGFGGTVASTSIADSAPLDPTKSAVDELPGTLAVEAGVEARGEIVEAMASSGSLHGREFGMIRGDITLAASIVSKLETITVRIYETMRDDGNRRPPYRAVHRIDFEASLGTPRFAIDEIPFSANGYLVQAFAPGLNGTEQIVTVDAGHPIADVVLGIHPGVPFSVLLRDQDRNPLDDHTVTLFPVEGPPGRGTHVKNTDNFGAAVFENVLRGRYSLVVGPVDRPLVDPPTIEVLGGGTLTVQSHTVIVPRGQPLTVSLFGPAGWGIADVTVKLAPSGEARFRELEQASDSGGRAVFDHVIPGTYWVNVVDSRFSPRTKQIVVAADTPPPELRINLQPRR